MSTVQPLSPLDLDIKKRYSLRETYWIARDAFRTIRHLRRLKADGGQQYAERIMLAVTEVNGCPLCAYAHTNFALEAGMDTEEVRQLLGGVTSDAPDHELSAIAFAQHYADTRGHPEVQAWDRIVEIYGEPEALGVLGATRMMMLGNTVGIPLSLLRLRMRGRPQPDSNLPHEIGTAVGGCLLLPIAGAHAGWSIIRREPLNPRPPA